MTASLAADLTAALAAGLFSSVHCVGMCGPLASLGCRAGLMRSGVAAPVLFATGKFLSYSLIGLLAGLIGAAFIGTNALGRATAVISLGGGVLMLVVLLLSRLSVRAFRLNRLSSSLAKLSLNAGARAPLILGASAALLPCGLLYAMVAKSAASGAPLAGMSLMQAFGIGTSPAVIGAGAIVRLIPARWARFSTIAAEIILALSALVLVWRGIAGLLMTPAHPSCCP